MSIKKNYLYNVIYQIVLMLMPLITIPYVSRVLEPSGVGTYAYTLSIIKYFMLVGMLGISTYGNKMVAMTRDDKKELSTNFFSIYKLQLILCTISIIFYIILVLNFFETYKLVALAQIFALLGTAFDCTWLFSGLEMFKKIVMRNILIKLIALIAVFLMVRSPEDLIIYTLIMSVSTFLGQSVMWLYVRKVVIYTHCTLGEIFKHLKPTFIYFLPQVAAQIYFVFDKTMLGFLSSNSEVGIYEYADNIQKVAVAVITSLGVVMLPRMANTYVKGDIFKAKMYINRSLDISTLIGVAIMFGIAGIASEFVPWYMGIKFLGTIKVLLIISPTILFMAWSGVFGNQYFVPLGKMREFSISLYSGASVNIVINLFLIKSFGAIGAAIGTLCAEIVVTAVQIFYVRNDIDVKKMIPKTFIYLICGSVMFIVVKYVGFNLGVSIFTTLIQIIVGVVIFVGSILLVEIFTKNGIILEELKKIAKKSDKVNR